ncbi:MAG: DNA translocase FtsK, partial [Clostridiaceae bacterium]|nr:DNA translocase FtsK [Clostridiaceae bacterium]
DKSNLKSKAAYTFMLLALVSAILHTGAFQSDKYQNLSPLDCIIAFYREGQGLSGGGVLGGIIALPLLLVFKPLGAIIILVSLSTINLILLTDVSIYSLVKKTRSGLASCFKMLVKGIREGKDYRDACAAEEEYGELKDSSDELQDNIVKINVNLPKTMDKDDKEVKEVPRIQVKKTVSREDVEADDFQEKEILGPTRKLHEILYKYPPINLLNANPDGGKSIRTYKNIALEGARKLEETLRSFGVEAKVVNVTVGPAVTRFELQPSSGVKVSRIVSLADDISLNLASQGVRIEAPIPGKAAVGIEVPNKGITPVFLREVIDSKEFAQHPSKVAFAVGKDISGECVVADIAKMPHLLIAGATGSGKSVCIKSLITSILYKSSPEEVKLILIDPKMVELNIYNGIPHLLIPVITEPKKAASALNWAVQEMVRRYKLFAEKGVRDIKGYNSAVEQSGEHDYLPLIVIIIDELSDLMMVAPGEVEDCICRLAQMARAAGMHLVVATQRPSVDVITGLIKANIPSRISFAVSSQVDSRTILDMGGAEKLLGNGDMLFYPAGQQKPVRLQGAFISEKEVEKIIGFIKTQCNSEYDDSVLDEISRNIGDDREMDDEWDEFLPQAIEMVIETGQASASLLQRKFKIGYARAARIIDQMEARGIVGRYEGSKPRQVLVTRQQWLEMKMSDSFEGGHGFNS